MGMLTCIVDCPDTVKSTVDLTSAGVDTKQQLVKRMW